jgi:hypothetical protein
MIIITITVIVISTVERKLQGLEIILRKMFEFKSD